MANKIATCCYCSTRAVLVIDKARHELSCSACGAPLHEMKSIPLPKQPTPVGKPRVPRQARAQYRPRPGKYAWERKPKRRRKSVGRRALEEIWDIIEDIFD